MDFPFANELEYWAGLECTINRVQDRYSNQCELNGHNKRPDDLKLFAELGITKLRYPVLWEVVAPTSLDDFNWTLSDERLKQLNELKITPIVGLLHHGSGPKYTDLLDPEFPEKLARYAKAVAHRYPWVEWYTPVNEPNTTARFSALYGCWYPHKADDKSFYRALYNEIKGTVLAMRAIREINPLAKLVQTDDLGRAQSTERLQYQAEFENERRWLSFDMLFGRLDSSHPLFEAFTESGGVSEEELGWLRENPCPPDIIGINHYPLSNRFLDERIELYPPHFHGGNGRDRYADVGAVDTGQTTPPLPIEVLREVWDRYQSPFAVTEVHIGGPRESQMRWLNEIRESALQLRAEGVGIRAITAWSLFGAFDWISLCTKCEGFYEPGVFDVRSTARPRPTALAKMLTAFARGEPFAHPVLEEPGYWRNPQWHLFAPGPRVQMPLVHAPVRPLIITGASGTLGQAFARICELRGIRAQVLPRSLMDIANPDSVRAALSEIRPWAVVNAAGFVRVDDAEAEQERCLRENAFGPQILAENCREFGIQLLTFSTDLVFDGNRNTPYRESDSVSPLSCYGRSKAEAEKRVLQTYDRALIVRTSSFFGPWDRHNFATLTREALKRGEKIRVPHDVTVSPTYVPDLVEACLDLLLDQETGILHLTNGQAISWADWAKRVAEDTRLPIDQIESCSAEELRYQAPRPRYSALESERLQIMPAFEKSWDRYLQSAMEER